jgi:hypothetical protein
MCVPPDWLVPDRGSTLEQMKNNVTRKNATVARATVERLVAAGISPGTRIGLYGFSDRPRAPRRTD